MVSVKSKARSCSGTGRNQSGAALLVFLLLIVVSASTLLLTRLNAAIKNSIYSPATSNALEEAKVSLLSWAVNHPFNPGTLPMPDRNGDSNYDGDADCFNGTITTSLLLGKLPWRGMPSPCKDAASLSGLSVFATDRSGEHLWYAVSPNLVYESPDYPFVSPGLLNKTTDWITVRDANGNIVSDRVAFVVIASGPAMSPYADCDGLSYVGQDRSGTAPDAGNYLDSVTIDTTTYSNADYDQDFIAYTNSIITNGDTTQELCDQFNDQLVFVTIDELMAAVSKRVLNETANVLTAWHNANGALPWLAPFADPKSDPRLLRGEATSAGSNLTDSSVDFTDWGVSNGDVVWNLTDGSRGIVTNVAANTLTIGAGLRFGSNNTFAVDDEYYVEIEELASELMNNATGGSSGLLLEDTTRNFEELGIQPGDIVDNLDDGSSGVVASVDGDKLTVAGLAGGTDNDFDNNDDYRIRSNSGRATADTDSNGLTLEDTNINFTTMGIQSGDLVRNITDGSYGTVTVISANRLTVGSLYDGTTNAFANNNYYTIQRYFPKSATRNGLLPVYFAGEPYTSGFNPAWNIASGSSVTNTPGIVGTTLDTVYTGAMTTIVKGSVQYPGSISVAKNNSSCLWVIKSVIDCRGSFTADLTTIFNGVTTGTAPGNWIVDSGEVFPAKGVKRGDKITNLTNSTQGIIRATSGTNTDRLQISNITGSANYSTTVGHSYKVSVATATMSGFPSAPTAEGVYRMYDTGVDFSDIQVGDIIENVNWTAIGRITAVNATANPRYVDFTALTDGTYPDFVTSEQYRIHYNFVDSRKYEFNLRIAGNSGEYPVSEQRVRDVCVGYGTDCTSAATNTAFSGDGATTTVAIKDYDASSQLVATTSMVLPVSGAAGSLKVSGLEYYLDVDNGDLPEWYTRNKWYQYVMVAYSNGEAPLISTCTAGTDCLTLNLRNAASTIIGSRNNVRALVMVSRDELSGQVWADAAATDYFDDATNTNLVDSIFEKYPESTTFNDLIRIAVSCPADASKLCWSN